MPKAFFLDVKIIPAYASTTSTSVFAAVEWNSLTVFTLETTTALFHDQESGSEEFSAAACWRSASMILPRSILAYADDI